LIAGKITPKLSVQILGSTSIGFYWTDKISSEGAYFEIIDTKLISYSDAEKNECLKK